MGVELVDLDDYDVRDRKLQCDGDDTDDDDVPKLEGMDISGGSASSSQCLESHLGSAAELLQSLVPV
jgi:hypothetical protein